VREYYINAVVEEELTYLFGRLMVSPRRHRSERGGRHIRPVLEEKELDDLASRPFCDAWWAAAPEDKESGLIFLGETSQVAFEWGSRIQTNAPFMK
jgi:hypothetical protein